MNVAQGVLGFQVELVDRAEPVTANAGLPLLIEAMRAGITRARYRELRNALGYASWKTVRGHVESVVLLVAAGGEHISDIEVLRGDRGLEVMLGFRLSGTTQLKDFLYRFHQAADGTPLTPGDDAELSVKGTARIRDEGPGLVALDAIVLEVVAAVQRVHARAVATLDVDATIIEAHKANALRAYEGTRGYQPQMAWWAEQGLWVCDQFRDGNVPAAYAVRDFLRRAFGNLPAGITTLRLRADSALYDEAALTWADDTGIDFAVSADMTEALAGQVAAIHTWLPYTSLSPSASKTEERQWAEVVDFIPGWARNNRAGTVPFRYIAIRVRDRQRDIFDGDEARWRHYAVVTNMDWRGDRLLRWHREKQGTVEMGHGVLKNDLGGGVLPCGRFGANAAWWRLNVLTHDLLELLKVQALPEDVAAARPKTLRFQLLHLPGRLVRHARRWTLRLYGGFPLAEAFVEARRRLVRLAELLHGPAPPLPA